MADKALTALTAATLPLDGTELMYLVQGGNSRKTPTSSINAGIVSYDNGASALLADNVQDAIDELVLAAAAADGDRGDITVSSSGTVWTIDNDSVTNAKLANMAQATVKGRAPGAGTGDPTDLTLDTDTSFAADSDSRVATQKATKAYVDSRLAANDALVYKGAIDASSNPNYPAADAGHTYRISVAGKIGGASGPNVEIGDRITCNVDSSSAGNHATVGANWDILQVNIDGAVAGPASVTDGNPAVFDGASGKLIKQRTFTQFTASLDAFVGDSGSGGTKGLVPAPAAGDAAASKVLGAGGTWTTVAGAGGVPTSRTLTAGNGLTGGGDLSADRSLAIDEASAAQIWANTANKVISTDAMWSAAAPVTLTDAATVAVDMSTFINAEVTLGGNRTLGQPSNTKNGQSGCIRIIQDGTGSRTLAYHADWKFAGGTDPTLSTAAGAVDALFYQVLAVNFIYATLVKALA